MHLFLTGVLPFLAHDHPSAVAFLTCRHHNFHGSTIPEFLSDEEEFKRFCLARQGNKILASVQPEHENLYNLFVQTPLMQFSPFLLLSQDDCNEAIVKPLLETKYFARTLQRCTFCLGVEINNDLLRNLSRVQSLTELDLDAFAVNYEHLEIIINSFPSLKTFTMQFSRRLDLATAAVNVFSSELNEILERFGIRAARNLEPLIRISSPPPPATKTLRSLTLENVDTLFVIQFVPHFTNLRKLELAAQIAHQKLNLRSLSSSLPFLTDLSFDRFGLSNVESLNTLDNLSSLEFYGCYIPDLNFLAQDIISLPLLTTLCIVQCDGLSTSSFASLTNAPNLRALNLRFSNFNNDCLQYLDDMIHLRKLDLSHSRIVGDSRLLKTLMQNLFQLEELNMKLCSIGNQGAIARALYNNKHNRLRVLNLHHCDLVDDDLNGIGALKNTLEVLHLFMNMSLTNEALVHCKDLVKLKKLTLQNCRGINDLTPLKDCSNLEELHVSYCSSLADDSFKVFSEEPDSFPNLRVLDLSDCSELTKKVFEHLANNNHLVHRLKELNVEGMSEILSSSETARNNLCRLKGLRRLPGAKYIFRSNQSQDTMPDFLRDLKNLEGV